MDEPPHDAGDPSGADGPAGAGGATSSGWALIALGSNLGDRDAHIDRALSLLAAETGVTLSSRSAAMTTSPVGGPPQPDFRNAACLVRTVLAPRELLRVLQRIEREVGREPGGPRWGPRVVDLDLLLYEDRVVDEPGLQIPHPRMSRRRFVLGPAAEIAPQMRHPVLDRTVRELLEDLT